MGKENGGQQSVCWPPFCWFLKLRTEVPGRLKFPRELEAEAASELPIAGQDALVLTADGSVA